MRQVNVRLIAATNRDQPAEATLWTARTLVLRVLQGRKIDEVSYRGYHRGRDHVLQFAHVPGQACCGSTVCACRVSPGDILLVHVVIFLEKIVHQQRNVFEPLREGRQSESDWRPLSLEEVRKSHIRRVLELCLGNRLRAAQILGIGRTSLYRYLKCAGYEMCAREKSGGAAA